MFRKFLPVLLAAFLAAPLLAETPVRRIFVTRHAQQPGKPGIIKADVHVTDLGLEQAALLGKYLKIKDFNGKIYASPYLRTVETAVYAGKELGCKVYPDARFQERVGDHRKGKDIPNTPNLKKGHTLVMFRELFPDGIAEDAKLADDWPLSEPEDYKTTHSARLMKGLSEAMKEQPAGDILIVSHGGALLGFRVGFGKLGCKVPDDVRGWNCAVYTYGVDKDGNYSFLDYAIDFIPEEKITSNFKYKNNPKAQEEFLKAKGKKTKKAKKAKKSEN